MRHKKDITSAYEVRSDAVHCARAFFTAVIPQQSSERPVATRLPKKTFELKCAAIEFH